MRIHNLKVFGSDFKFHDGEICTAGERLSAVSIDNEVLDGQGLYAIPGLIDIHFHGANGHDFMEGTPEALSAIASYEASAGVTAICPATMTMSKEDILKACANGAAFKPQEHEASLVGIYMEGPFVSPKKVGAQNPVYVHAPDLNFYKDAQRAAQGLIKIMAIAPEEPGAMEVIAALNDEVLPSIAHTCASYEVAREAIAKGAAHLTHLYNAMPPLHHRDPGPIAAGSDAPWCEAELICDGIHIHPAAVRAAFRLFGEERIILISDSMMACGLKDGVYSLGGQRVTVKGRKAFLDSGTIAGSVTDLFSCMRIAHQVMGLSPETAVRAATYNPARSIGALKDYGTLGEGKIASFNLVDASLNLRAVILRGKVLTSHIPL